MKKDCSLSNKSNKQRFITLLALHLKRRGIGVLHAGADADVLVVQTAVASAERHNTVLVGDDTDLLVLLCSRQVDIKYDIYFRPEPKSNSQEYQDVGTLRTFVVLLEITSVTTFCSHMPYWDATQLLECLALGNLFS